MGMPSIQSQRNLHIAQIGQISALIRVFIPLHQIAPLGAISAKVEIEAKGPANLMIRGPFSFI
jgi:hypothetical protein